jgi:GH18 family chitinase
MGSLLAFDYASVRGEEPVFETEIHHVSDGVGLVSLVYLHVLSNYRQHNVVPEPALVADVTHVALAFMQSGIFNDVNRTEWPLFTAVEDVRSKFAKGTVIQVAIGGWGDTAGFEMAAKTEQSRDAFAGNVKAMLEAMGADGVDIDWEYPG